MKKEQSKKYRIIQVLRILSQTAFFGLFMLLLFGTHYTGQDYIGRVEIFFHFDPLLAISTFIASRTVQAFFALAAITILITFILGRVVCGWVCPLGAVHQFFSFLFKKAKLLKLKNPQDTGLYWKYYLLVFILVGTLLSLNLVGIFDPLSLLYRSFTTSFLPAFSHSSEGFVGLFYQINLSSFGDSLNQFFENLALNSTFRQGFFLGVIFLSFLLLNMKKERFWCRYLCPLGALLGLVSRWNILKLRIDTAKCTECNLCNIHCETLASPFPEKKWKSPECVYCFTCGEICPTGAIGFHPHSSMEKAEAINLTRRRIVFSSLLAVAAVPLFRISPSSRRASPKLIRPPGALPEKTFLQKCIRCGECMKVCPTNALQPALSEAGPEGIWTPLLVPKIGYCEYYCSLCSQVCPTGAIKPLTVGEKIQVKIGLAWIDKNRCIPYDLGIPCIVCEEHCPTSPKAIKLVKIEVKLPDGTIKNPKAPVVITDLCIGCGICEYKCPVVDDPAIYITSIQEARSEKNQLLLPTYPEETDILE